MQQESPRTSAGVLCRTSADSSAYNLAPNGTVAAEVGRFPTHLDPKLGNVKRGRGGGGLLCVCVEVCCHGNQQLKDNSAFVLVTKEEGEKQGCRVRGWRRWGVGGGEMLLQGNNR